MKKYLKFIISFYNCFCFLILLVSLILSIKINRDIYSQRKILKKQEIELNYITNLNNEIKIYSKNIEFLDNKIKEKNTLNEEINSLIEQDNILNISINNLNNINKNLENKIKSYE